MLAMIIAAAGFVSGMPIPVLALGAALSPCITFESNPPCSLTSGSAVSTAVTVPVCFLNS